MLELNRAEIPHLGSLSATELAELVPMASHFHVAEDSGEIVGFLIAMDEASAYQSMNFLWFKSRYPKFTYVDRLAVVPTYQGKGLGRRLYDNLENLVGKRSSIIACEVNIRPPNPQSLNFHTKIGFREAGQQDTEEGKKRVALLIRNSATK
jgi:predicted GNAT superfamily acetyltransferase